MSDLRNRLQSILSSDEYDIDKEPLKHDDEFGDFLAHYGVKGMRWGFRKDSSGKRRPTKEVKAETKRNKRKKAATTTKGRASNKLASNPQNRGMTDRQMKQAIDRIRLQQEFNRLTAVPPNPPNKVAKFMGEVGRDVAKGAMTEVGKLVLSQALKTEYNKRAAPEYQVPVKQIAEAIEKAKNS